MSIKTSILVTILCFLSVTTFAQRNYDQYNNLGLYGGLNLFNIQTDHFNTEQGNGVTLGFVTRGDVYNNFDLEYGISFTQNTVGIYGRDLSSPANNFNAQYIDYQIQSAQVKLIGGYNIILHHLSVEFGPILNVNGKMKLKSESYENFILDGYSSVRASDLENVSRVHFHLAGGITAGLRNFRLNAQYQYGVTNLFNRFNEIAALEGEAPEGGFEGHTSTIIFGVYFYF